MLIIAINSSSNGNVFLKNSNLEALNGRQHSHGLILISFCTYSIWSGVYVSSNLESLGADLNSNSLFSRFACLCCMRSSRSSLCFLSNSSKSLVTLAFSSLMLVYLDAGFALFMLLCKLLVGGYCWYTPSLEAVYLGIFWFGTYRSVYG